MTELEEILGLEWPVYLKDKEKVKKIEQLIRKRELEVLRPIDDITDKMSDEYGEFEALDDIEKYVSEKKFQLQKEQDELRKG